MVNRLNHGIPRQSTLKDRSITIGLSDKDCEQLMKRCSMYGITVDQLLENFIGDLVSGTHSNGSDERMFANKWFDRCWFSYEPKNTLLKHLLDYGYDPEEFIYTIDALDSGIREKEFLRSHPEECDEDDIAAIDEMISSWQYDLTNFMNGWVIKENIDLESELTEISKWLDERTIFLTGLKPEILYQDMVRQIHYEDVIQSQNQNTLFEAERVS